MQEYRVIIQNVFTAETPEEAAKQMSEWLTDNNGAASGAYKVYNENTFYKDEGTDNFKLVPLASSTATN